jgi:hypothetical protein
MKFEMSRRDHLRRLLKAIIWAAAAAAVGRSLGLQPTWQLIVFAVACIPFDFAGSQWAPSANPWGQRAFKLVLWAITLGALCWLLGLPPTWQLLVFAVACTLIDLALDLLLPTPPIIRIPA